MSPLDKFTHFCCANALLLQDEVYLLVRKVDVFFDRLLLRDVLTFNDLLL